MAFKQKVEARITENEWSHIEVNCKKHGIKSSEYIRRLIEHDIQTDAIGNSVTVMDMYRQRKELIAEVNYIGHNINQIVKNVNSHFYSEYEKKKLFAMMEKLIERVATSPLVATDTAAATEPAILPAVVKGDGSEKALSGEGT